MAPPAISDDRRDRLLELVRRSGFASLPDLVSAMDVSESTIRRDLDWLEENGKAKRTHGGVFYTGPAPKLPHFDQRQNAALDQKQQIAQQAANLVDDGDTLLLDGGTTTYELAKHLVGRPLQIVTNSLPVANLFTSSANTDLVFIGGYIHMRTGVSLGPYANDMIGDLNVHRAILSVAGINTNGCYNSNLLLVETEKAMIRAADKVVVVADSTKFGKKSLAHICELSEMHTLVVDDKLSDAWRARVTDAGVNLTIAEDL